MKQTVYKIIAILVILTPFILLAQSVSAQQNVDQFLNQTLTRTINAIIRFLIVVASLIFIFYVVKYITSANDPEQRTEARQYIIYAIIGLVIILVFWGIVNLIVNSLGNLDNRIPEGRIPRF